MNLNEGGAAARETEREEKVVRIFYTSWREEEKEVMNHKLPCVSTHISRILEIMKTPTYRCRRWREERFFLLSGAHDKLATICDSSAQEVALIAGRRSGYCSISAKSPFSAIM